MISIITPILNGKQYINGCIQNVESQGVENYEHILVDGGSTDGTIEAIQVISRDHPRIRWISEPDLGQSDALNKGVRLARGGIIGVLNVDDYFESLVLKRVIELFNELPVPSFLVGNCNIWAADGSLLMVNKPNKLRLYDLVLGPYFSEMPFNPSAYFYHKSLHEKIGYYRLDEHFVLDWDFILRAVQVAHVKYVDELFGNFRMLENNKTVIDIKQGNSVRRQREILSEYRKDLPYLSRIQATLLDIIYNHIWVSINFFRSHPNEFGWRFKARLAKIFGFK